MKVYIISGKAGAGKNTTANYIKEYYESIGKKAAITEIAKYIKMFAYELLNWDGERETKPRDFLQTVGSYVRHEAFNEDFFINRILEDLKIYEKLADVVIVADGRFPNEIEKIKSNYDAVSIQVINEFSESELNESEKKHESETSLDSYNNYDYIIHNKTFEQLKNDAENIVKEVEK